MNRTRVEDQWHQLLGLSKSLWVKLRDAELRATRILDAWIAQPTLVPAPVLQRSATLGAATGERLHAKINGNG